MRTTLLLPAALLGLSASAFAGEPASSHAWVYSTGQKDAQGDGVSVYARDAKGTQHALKMEARDGRVLVHGEPDANRPWLGVLLSDEDEIERLGNGLPAKPRRWTITAVADGSPAQKGGLRRGDVVLSVDGRDIEVSGPGMLEGAEPGDVLRFQVERDGDTRRVEVKVGSHPGTVEFEDADGLGAMDVAGNMLGNVQGLEALRSLKKLERLPCPPGMKPEDCPGLVFGRRFGGGPRLGVSVEPMGEQLARFFGAPAGRGLLVKDVLHDTPAERAGIEAGDVILRVAGRDIDAPGDIREALEGHEGGDVVTVDVLRRGESRTLRVTLEDEAEEHGSFDARAIERLAEAAGATGRRAALTEQQRKEIEVALDEARSALSPERRAEIERALSQERKAMTPQQRRELETAMDELRRAYSPENVDELRRAVAEAQASLEQARNESRRPAASRARKDELRAAEDAAGAYDAQVRQELERSLQGDQVRPREVLIEF